MIYSTCSIWPQENGDQIQWLTSKYPQLKIIELQTTLPSTTEEAARHRDGGFFAVLQLES